ncbi:hypothetical protein J19TS2_18460 [Cohnella xylanilytica]|uniref:DegT/DnrJ/EryC1/StrS family aminotransferase n=1 Tax=Cohnella xylanilytica TaxID=557555 RepID=UPI001B2C4168|nr:DegT/DnrJ/EryC1/StrS family aminotransferase [Cohnella xylanilytica]GIO12291.1 hypothetical protein J19TS2_18460 [Cohnella xylanilytica]
MIFREVGSEYFLEAAGVSATDERLEAMLGGYRAAYYDSGRSALRSVLSDVAGRKALVPAYICQSVIQAFREEGYKPVFYGIRRDLSIDMEDIREKLNAGIDVFFFMNYYGVLQNTEHLKELRGLCDTLNCVIIEDTTHSLLTRIRTIGDYGIASLRKWFALPDGGVAYSSERPVRTAERIERSAFSDKRTAGMFLKGLQLRGEGEYNAIYRRLFAEAESDLDNQRNINAMSEFSRGLLASFPTGKSKRIRLENADYLAAHIRNPLVTALFPKYDRDACPFFYPVYVAERDRFREYLNRHRIYCPVHWPIEENGLVDVGDVRFISERILSLPIDQRYSTADMRYLCAVINEYDGG